MSGYIAEIKDAIVSLRYMRIVDFVLSDPTITSDDDYLCRVNDQGNLYCSVSTQNETFNHSANLALSMTCDMLAHLSIGGIGGFFSDNKRPTRMDIAAACQQMTEILYDLIERSLKDIDSVEDMVELLRRGGFVSIEAKYEVVPGDTPVYDNEQWCVRGTGNINAQGEVAHVSKQVGLLCGLPGGENYESVSLTHVSQQAGITRGLMKQVKDLFDQIRNEDFMAL